MIRVALACLLLFPLLIPAAFAADLAALVESAERAQTSAEFSGRFVVIQGEQIQSFSVARAIDPDRPQIHRERVQLLNGPSQEIERHTGSATCIFSADGVLLNAGLPDRPLLPMPGVITRSRHYALRDLGEDRVAGFLVRGIEMTPLDQMRYRHQFWLEPRTGLLLRSLTADSEGRAVAQMMFTQLEVGRPGISWRENLPPAAESQAGPAVGPRTMVEADIPIGFELVRSERTAGDRSRYQVYSDGLASFSIYVEPIDPSARQLDGPATRGPLNLYGVTLDSLHVTVVGEIPAEAAERLARSTRTGKEG